MLFLGTKGLLPDMVEQIAATAYIPLISLVERTGTLPFFERYLRLWVRPQPEILYDSDSSVM